MRASHFQGRFATLKISKEKAGCISIELYPSVVFPAKLQSSSVYVGVYLGAIQPGLMLLLPCMLKHLSERWEGFKTQPGAWERGSVGMLW